MMPTDPGSGRRRAYSTCEAEVDTRDGLQPCDRAAVGMRVDPDGAWPACEQHLAATYLGEGRWTL